MIARGLAENGARVYITGRRKEILEKVVNSGVIKGDVVAYVHGYSLVTTPLMMDALGYLWT